MFLFFAFLFGPGVVCNALFHSAASLRTRSHCPGVLLYLPLAGWLAWLAVRDRWLSPRELLLALVIAALGHVAEVGHTVFKRW